ncbi:hypothetical protein EJ03DRAFT_109913 [Teratosphaeria nubilosa]|uniref:Uncharacterized protein n=1 Tax=Teratosphaeria nubilosa TaxID=161662 RepID=A0A6G1L8Z0_9PEZI|nr:hypothetical protein EJ03DRAFT_109913 [Teratosphaeria nubilosa]
MRHRECSSDISIVTAVEGQVYFMPVAFQGERDDSAFCYSDSTKGIQTYLTTKQWPSPGVFPTTMKSITSTIDHHFDPHGPWTPGMLLGQKKTLIRDQNAAFSMTLADVMDGLGLEPTGEGRWMFEREVNAAFVPSWVATTRAHVGDSSRLELRPEEVEGLRQAARVHRERKLISFSKPVTGYFGPCGLSLGEYEGGVLWRCSRRVG